MNNTFPQKRKKYTLKDTTPEVNVNPLTLLPMVGGIIGLMDKQKDNVFSSVSGTASKVMRIWSTKGDPDGVVERKLAKIGKQIAETAGDVASTVGSAIKKGVVMAGAVGNELAKQLITGGQDLSGIMSENRNKTNERLKKIKDALTEED